MLWGGYDQADIYPSQADLDSNHGNYPEITGVAEELRSRATLPLLVHGHLPYVIRDLFPPDAPVITVLRDPVARSISVLRFAKRRKTRFADSTLDEIFDDGPLREGMITNYQTKVFAIRHIGEVESVNHPLHLEPWRLELALENLADCDMVAFTERFLEVSGQLDGLSIPHRETLRMNTAKRNDPDASPELLDRISEAVALDMQLYETVGRVSAARSGD
jgi:hypothetical protein